VTNDQIKQWLEDHFKRGDVFRYDTESLSLEDLRAFAEFVAAAEREACAEVAYYEEIEAISEDRQSNCADKIRARGVKE